MNAHTRSHGRVPDPTLVQRLIRKSGNLIGLAYELGACRTAAEAEKAAAALEEQARAYVSRSPPASNDLGPIGFSLTEDCIYRASLWRERAQELRS